MKKLLIVLLLSLCPIMVFADAGGPSIVGYDAIVTNKNGAKVIESEKNITIKYNTKIYVYDEYDNEVYACYPDKKGGCDYERDTFTLNRKDISPIKKEITPKDLSISNYNEEGLQKVSNKLFVSNRKGIRLKKGPAGIYDEYSEIIPYKEILESSYAFLSYHQDSWYYIDNGTYKGWIKKDIAPYVNSKIITCKDLKIYNVDTDTIIMTIPAETIIDNYYDSYSSISDSTLSEMNYSHVLYVNYDEHFGYIKDDDHTVAYESDPDSKLLVMRSTEMKSKGKAISAIAKGEEIKPLFYGDGTYYVEYSNVQGFINSDDVVYFTPEEIETKSYDEDKYIYNVNYSSVDSYELEKKETKLDEYSKQYKTNKVVPASTKVKIFGYYDLYEYTGRVYRLNLIKYNETIGWVISEIDESNMFDSYKKTDSEDVIYIVPDDKKDTNQTSMLIIYCVAGAVILGLTAFVIIKLINRKKKKAKEEPNKEQPKVNIEEPQKQEESQAEPQNKEGKEL